MIFTQKTIYDKTNFGHKVDVKLSFLGEYYIYIDDKFYKCVSNFEIVNDVLNNYIELNKFFTVSELA